MTTYLVVRETSDGVFTTILKVDADPGSTRGRMTAEEYLFEQLRFSLRGTGTGYVAEVDRRYKLKDPEMVQERIA